MLVLTRKLKDKIIHCTYAIKWCNSLNILQINSDWDSKSKAQTSQIDKVFESVVYSKNLACLAKIVKVSEQPQHQIKHIELPVARISRAQTRDNEKFFRIKIPKTKYTNMISKPPYGHLPSTWFWVTDLRTYSLYLLSSSHIYVII